MFFLMLKECKQTSMNNLKRFLGGLTPEQFMQEYWEKKSLIVKDAIDVSDLATSEQLLEMAQDENYETRMVWGELNNKKIECLDGPFSNEKLKTISKGQHTLIVHNLNLYFEEFFNIQKMFDFIPSWLHDDIMATASIKGATLGAHIDNYNVFIIQGMGSREWKLQSNPNSSYIDELPIKVLQQFAPDQTYILKPGDMLFIPAGMAHQGTSLSDESISYSVGLRGLDYQMLAQSFLGYVVDNYKSENYFKENNLQKDSYEITALTLKNVQSMLTQEIFKPSFTNDWFAKSVTTPRSEVLPNELEVEEIKDLLQQQTPLRRDPFTRFNYTINENKIVTLYVNGKSYSVKQTEIKSILLFLETPTFNITTAYDLNKSQQELLIELIQDGAFYFDFD